MKIAIVGSRSFTDYGLMKNRFLQFAEKESWDIHGVTVISGGAPGADTLAERLADDIGCEKCIMKADWNNLDVPGTRIKVNNWGRKYNANAGHARNQKMAEKTDVVIAFRDGKSPGTGSMINKSRKLGKQVFIVKV